MEQKPERGRERMQETVRTICTVMLTLCTCILVLSILYENVMKGKEKKKMLQDINKYLESINDKKERI